MSVSLSGRGINLGGLQVKKNGKEKWCHVLQACPIFLVGVTKGEEGHCLRLSALTSKGTAPII